VEAAVLEEDVLAGDEAVAGAGEGVGEGENGRRGAGVFDAGVAVGRDAKAEVVVAGVLEGEADVGGKDDVLRRGVGVEFDSAAVEAEEEGVFRAGVEEVELAGGADKDFAAAGERDGGWMVVGSDAGVGEEAGGVTVDFEAAGHEGVVRGDGAHGGGCSTPWSKLPGDPGCGLLGVELWLTNEQGTRKQKAYPRG
jgi:hypothetical protein